MTNRQARARTETATVAAARKQQITAKTILKLQGVFSMGLVTLMLGIHPEGNTLFLLAMLRGMNLDVTLSEANDNMLALLSPLAQHFVERDSAD